MSKSPLYLNFKEGNSNQLLDFLSSNGVWNSPELDCVVTVKFSFNGEQIEFPLYRNLPTPKIKEVLEKLGFSYSDFEKHIKGNL